MKKSEATTATIRRVARPRGTLSDQTLRELADVLAKKDAVEAEVRAVVVKALHEGSFSAVHQATGLSTNTLQRWKNETATD